MASAYSTPRQYQKYLSEWNFDVLAKAMGTKQGQYNTGRANLQAQYNQLGNLDLLKDEDKAHFQENMLRLKQQVDMAGMGDLSLAGAGDNVMNYFNKAKDGKVLNAYAGTKQYRSVQQSALAAKEDGSYSDLNYAYSMRDLDKWANDGQSGTQFKGSATYVPYTDKQAKIVDIFKEHKPNIQVVKTRTGVQYLNEKHEIMTSQEVEGILETLVYSDPAIAQQMKVDSWGQFRGLEDGQVSETLKGKIVEKRDGIEKLIKSGKYKGDQLKSLEASRTNYNSDINNWDTQFSKNPTAYKEFYYKQGFTQSVKDIYVKDNIVGITSITDQAALAGLKHANSLKLAETKSKLQFALAGRKGILGLVGADKDASQYARMLDNMGSKPTGHSSWTSLITTQEMGNLPTKTDPKEIEKVLEEGDIIGGFKLKKANNDVTINTGIDKLSSLLELKDKNKLASILTQAQIESKITEYIKSKKGPMPATFTTQVNNLLKQVKDAKVSNNTLSKQEEKVIAGINEAIPVGQAITARDGRTYVKLEDGSYLKQDSRTAKEVVKDVVSSVGNTIADYGSVLYNKAAAKVDVSFGPLIDKGETGRLQEEARTIDWDTKRTGNPTNDNVIDKLQTLLKVPKTELNIAQKQDIVKYVENLKGNIPALIAAEERLASENSSILRENNGEAFKISGEQFVSQITSDFKNDKLDGDTKELIKTGLSKYTNESKDIVFGKSVYITNTTNKDLQGLFNLAVGENIDFDKKADSKNLKFKINQETGMVEFSGEKLDSSQGGVKEYKQIEGQIELDQALQNSVISQTYGILERDTRVEQFNSSVETILQEEEEDNDGVPGFNALSYKTVVPEGETDAEFTPLSLEVNIIKVGGLPDIQITGDPELSAKLQAQYNELRVTGKGLPQLYTEGDYNSALAHIQYMLDSYTDADKKNTWKGTDGKDNY